MWILIRLVLAGIGFAIRQFSRNRQPSASGMLGDTAYFVRLNKHKGRLKGFSIGMERASPTWIRLHAESRADRLFKSIGIANEVQTGDPEFDRRVYVTCDHPHVATVLTETAALRTAILAMFEDGYHRIAFDGTVVWAECKSNQEPADRDVELLKGVWLASARLSDVPTGRTADRFLWKALVVEGVIWRRRRVRDRRRPRDDLQPRRCTRFRQPALDHCDVCCAGGVCRAPAGDRGVAARVIARSSCDHRIGSGAAGGDTADERPGGGGHEPSARPLNDHDRRTSVHAVRDAPASPASRRCYYSYHLHLTPDSDTPGPALPSEIEIVQSLCHAAVKPGTVKIGVGLGRWNIPWYRSITIGGTTWKSGM